MKRKPKVLFFSTGNATRSRMAEAFFRRDLGDKLEAASTAVASIEASPIGQEVMQEVGLDIEHEEAAPIEQSLKEHFACVVTLSDDAAERSPVWPFTRTLLHWNMIDPAWVKGTTEERRSAFRAVRDEIRQRVGEFTNTVGRELVSLSR